MQIKINQKKLAKAINKVQKAITSRTTLPILKGILIKTNGDNLKLTATDLEIGIETQVDCEIIERGSIVIESKIFGDIIRKLPDSDIMISTPSENTVHITCNHSEFNIVSQPAVEYPELPKINNDISFNIPRDLFKNMIRQTIFAAAQDEIKPILTGALLEVSNNEVSLVALDGYRLAVKNAPIDCNTDIKVVIPSKTLVEVSKILEDDDSDINIMFTKSHILFNIDNSVIISTLLEGEFINYKDIIRNEYKSRVKVKTKDMQESIERASLLARVGKNNLVKFNILDEKMTITSNSEIGNIVEEVSIDLEGNDLKIGFNSKYVLDALKVIDSEEVYLNLVSSVNPCIIKPVDDSDYTYLVLPVRLIES